jgi:hypothetical protein
VARVVKIWTWDRGLRPVDMDSQALRPILETVLQGALWDQLQKFPADTVERILPLVDVPPETRRLVEIWIEERRKRRPAA